MTDLTPNCASFQPAENLGAYRKALGRFTTGIAVVTAAYRGDWVGMTINSFSSISLSPPLIIWASDKKSSRYTKFLNASHFAVHVLSSAQKQVCDDFISSPTAFDRDRVRVNNNGVPILPDCLAIFECRQNSTVDAGDHSIILGDVQHVSASEGDPLIFWGGNITGLATAQNCPA
ncbi:MAG: flavin reductase family protein [Henriciella sp.]